MDSEAKVTPGKVRRLREILVGLCFLTLWAGACQTQDPSAAEPVGQISPNRYVTPTHQVLTPIGIQVELGGMRPQAVALSPDGSLLATSGKTQELVLIDPQDGRLVQRVPLPSAGLRSPDAVSGGLLEPDKTAQLSYTGLIFSPDGSRIYLSNVKGDIKVFQADPNAPVRGLFSIPLPPADAPGRKQEIPAGLALSRDGRRLYVALNLSNRLAEIDTASGAVLRSWPVGVAPYGVALVGDKVYVSNWGGRLPDGNSPTGPAGQGTRVRVDTVRGIASEGSVTVISLAGRTPTRQIVVGLHASALVVSPDRSYVVVANAGSDTLSVINTRSDEVVETIWVKSRPSDPFGASPNALAFDPLGDRLYVANGAQNAVAVIRFDRGASRLLGLIPVGWFPGDIAYDAMRDRLIVANIKGCASTRGLTAERVLAFNTHQYHGTLSLVPVPGTRELPALTRRVLDNDRQSLLKQVRQPARPNQRPRPVPERVGEPSVFEHVVYIIKENRTYDQVLGDIPEGNGDRSLCIFGGRITPNQHRMARQFVLLDNTYCSGICSADGHQWTDTAFATDYMERSFADFPRSFPDGMGDHEVDALAYAPSGFIWDNALAHGKSLRVYGEFAITETAWVAPDRTGKPTFLEHYRDFINDTRQIRSASRPALESLRPYLNTRTVGWDLDVPDVLRAARFIDELHEYERAGKFPHLLIISLPNDHTSGTRAGSPTPAAQMADNDLAFGRIVEALSRSIFWPKTCVFAIEDDPQNGWDHVSGFRTTAYVVSPYTRRRTVVHTQYDQTSILRTIELILGLPPMNQLDATATPMTDCFTDRRDLSPFVAVPPNIPLDQMNPDPKKIPHAVQREDAIISARLDLGAPDRCPEDVLNRILWRAMRGPATPYPQWAVTLDTDD